MYPIKYNNIIIIKNLKYNCILNVINNDLSNLKYILYCIIWKFGSWYLKYEH